MGEGLSGACTGVRCDGMKPFFLNSLQMVIPAVLISSLIGAFNGYVLTHWRFRGADALFTMMLVGCFIPFQVILLPMARLQDARPRQHDSGPRVRARRTASRSRRCSSATST